MKRSYPSAFISLCAALAASSLVTAHCASTGAKDDSGGKEAVQEIRVGRALAARLINKYGIVRNQEQVRYIGLVGRSLARVSSRPELDFHFGILDTDEVNAFACPGGYILVTKGALRLMDNEAELAGVLAHEIAHVALRHSGEFRVQETTWLEFVAGILGGGNVMSTAFHKVTGDLEKKILENGRQKDLEFEADKAGLLYAAAVGYQPVAAITYLERTARAKGNDVLVKTHPNSGDRIGGIRRFINEEGLRQTGVLNRERFQKYFSPAKLK